MQRLCGGVLLFCRQTVISLVEVPFHGNGIYGATSRFVLSLTIHTYERDHDLAQTNFQSRLQFVIDLAITISLYFHCYDNYE
jgi:hypothetical protein